MQSIRITAQLLLLSLLAGCARETDVLYRTDLFTVSRSGVTQGTYRAEASGDSVLKSNYFGHPRDLYFKFSINGGDNETGYRQDHAVLLYADSSGQATLPDITFGTHLEATEKQFAKSPFLEPNTVVRFRVDMRPVLKAIGRDGFYRAYNGEEIRKVETLSIVGSRPPLDWDFRGSAARPDLQFRDPDGDSIYAADLVFNKAELEGGSRVWRRPALPGRYPAFSSGIPLLDANYALALDELEKNRTPEGVWDTGALWKGVWTRDVSYSILLSLAALDPEAAKASLRKKVSNGRIVQDTGTGGSWPVSSDRMIWALAALEVYKVTGDATWLDEVYPIIAASATDDLATLRTTDGGVRGETTFADWRDQSYPAWMNPVEIYHSEAADNTAIHAAAYRGLAEAAARRGDPDASRFWNTQADTLQARLERLFFMPEAGYYAQFRYGSTFPVRSDRMMAMANALPVVFGLAGPGRARALAASVPVYTWGIPTFHPQIPGLPAYHNNGIWPFVQHLWNWALADAGGGEALAHGLATTLRASSLFLTNKENLRADNGDDTPLEINSDRQLWSVAGQLSTPLRILAGMRFSADSLHFRPAVPESFRSRFSLSGFSYRGAVLDIVVEGTGNRVARFELDGVSRTSAAVSGRLTGRHTIRIELTPDGTALPPRLTGYEESLATPSVTVQDRVLTWGTVPGADRYVVFVNGKKSVETDGTQWTVSGSPFLQTVQIQAAAAGRRASFLSAPVEFYPAEAALSVPAGPRPVDVTPEANRRIRVRTRVPAPGRYRIDVLYANGAGPINTNNQCAIRTLHVNGKRAGAMVMPQRGDGAWSDFGYSSSIQTVVEGDVLLELSYEPENRNMNGAGNRALVQAFRLVRLPE